VVVDEQPVADVGAGAVERDRLAVEQVGDEQRDDLLGEVVGPVVVAAPGDRDVQAVGLRVRPGEQVTAVALLISWACQKAKALIRKYLTPPAMRGSAVPSAYLFQLSAVPTVTLGNSF